MMHTITDEQLDDLEAKIHTYHRESWIWGCASGSAAAPSRLKSLQKLTEKSERAVYDAIDSIRGKEET